MKNLFLIILLSQVLNYTYAQDLKKGYFGSAVGLSVPTGNYGSSNGNNSESGFATAGFYSNLNFNYKFNDNLGIASLISSNSNGINSDAIIEAIAGNESNLVQLESNSWRSVSILAGLLYSIPYDKIELDFKAMPGIALSSSPKLIITASDGISSATVNQARASTVSLAFGLGAGFRYNLDEKTAFTFNLDYLTSKPEYEVLTTTSPTFSSSISNIEQSISMINISFGIGFRLK